MARNAEMLPWLLVVVGRCWHHHIGRSEPVHVQEYCYVGISTSQKIRCLEISYEISIIYVLYIAQLGCFPLIIIFIFSATCGVSLPHSQISQLASRSWKNCWAKRRRTKNSPSNFHGLLGAGLLSSQHSVETKGPHETCFFVLLGVIFFKDLVKFIPTPHDITTKGSLYRDVLLKLGLLELLVMQVFVCVTSAHRWQRSYPWDDEVIPETDVVLVVLRPANLTTWYYL